MTTVDITASDLIDHEIHQVAPFYGLDVSQGLLEQLDSRLVGPLCKSLRFLLTYDRLLLDKETGATWETFDLGPNTEHWYHGQITINEDRVGEYFRGWDYDTTREDLIPDISSFGELIVSEKARSIIEDFAPGFCYFVPAVLVGQQSGKQIAKPFFQVFVRQTLAFKGPPQRPAIRPKGQRYTLVDPNLWTSFCHSPVIQNVASSLPIFLFNRNEQRPVLRADLFLALKRAGVSGLLESTYYDTVDPKNSGRPIAFETVFPLDPNDR